MRRWSIRIGLGFAALLIVAALFLTGIGIFIRTEAGESWVAKTVGNAASSPDQTIAISGLSGALPFDVRIQRVAIADRSGVWLTIDDAVVEIDGWSLLKGLARIERLSTTSINVVRAPATTTSKITAKPASGEPFSLPRLPVALELDKLAVDRIDIAAAAAGQAIVLGIGGEARLAGGAGHALLDVKRFDGPGSLALHADYEPGNGGTLGLQLNVAEPSGVLLADLLPAGQSLPLKIDLAGKGPLADWHGRLDATAGNDARVGADLALRRVATALAITLAGDAKIASLLPAQMRAPIGDTVALDLGLRVADAGPITVERMKLSVGAGMVAMNGAYDPANGALSGQADVSADLASLGDLAGGPSSGKLALNAVVSGSVSQPSAKLTLDGAAISVAGTAIGHAGLVVNVAPAKGDLIAVTGNGRLDSLVASGLPPSAGLGDGVDLAFELSTDATLKRVDLGTLSVTGAGLDLAASGKLDNGRGDGHAKLVAANLAKFNALAGMALGGGITLNLDASIVDGTAIEAKLSGGYNNLRTGIPAAEAALGTDGSLTLSANRAANGVLAVKDLKLIAANLSVAGGGSYDPSAANAAGQIVLDIPELRPIGRALGSAMSGRVKLIASGAGNRADLKLDGDAITLGTATIDHLLADIAVPDLHKTAAVLTASINHGKLAAALDAHLSEPLPGQLVLSDLKLAGPETALDGNLTLDTAHRVATGKIDAKIANLAAWSPMIGQSLAGKLSVMLDLTTGNVAKPSQNAVIAASVDNLASGAGKDAIRLKSARIDAHLTDLLGQPGGRAEIDASGFVTQTADINALKLVASSQKTGLFAGSLDMTGSAGARPLSLASKATITATVGDQKLILTALDAHYGDLMAHLDHAFSAERKGVAISLNDLALAVAGGRIVGNAAYDGKTVSASIDASSLSIGAFGRLAGRNDASGTASLKLALDGPIGGPHGQADLAIRDLAFDVSGQQKVPINLTASAVLAPQSLSFKGRLEGAKGEAGLDLAGSVPVAFATTGGVSVPPGGAIQASVQGSGRLEPLNDIAPIGEDRMAGKYAIDLSVTGTIANPQAGGTLSVTDASYTNDASGMTLRNLQIQLAGQGRQFTLVKLSAGDGDDGTLTASGKVDLDEAGPSFDLAAALKSFTGARTDEATMVLSGTAKIGGSLAAPHVVSNLTIDRADINIPQQLPANYAKLDVIRVNSAHPLPVHAAAAPAPSPLAATLDIKIHDANRTFVRGDGLDSEWKGDLAISGTSSAPNVTGELQSISGTFSVLGKDFTLQRGVIDFLGSTAPVFDIQAQAQTADVTAIVELQGTPDQPKLTLSSVPALPQDEILSRVMFGSGTSQLTPVQGLQIAAAAASLAGGGGPGVLDRLRNYTGLDRLSLGQDNTNGSNATQGSGVGSGTSVSGGKYVAPGVYVGVAQGISGSSTRATVQVNITPNVTVNATVGTGDNSGSSLGAQYQLDY